MDQAAFEIDVAIGRTIHKPEKQALALLAVGFPLEAGNAVAAEQQLQRHRAEIADVVLIEFYEARVAHLRRDFAAATAKLAHVIQSTRDDPQSLPLAREAALWLEIVQGDQRVAEALKKAAAEAQGPSSSGESKK
jgi:hypothetical protein